jgi:hypothetical protein
MAIAHGSSGNQLVEQFSGTTKAIVEGDSGRPEGHMVCACSITVRADFLIVLAIQLTVGGH